MLFGTDQYTDIEGGTQMVKEIYVIQFSNGTGEQTSFDHDAYVSVEAAEKHILKCGYEKKFNWNNTPFYEKKDKDEYANILSFNLIS